MNDINKNEKINVYIETNGDKYFIKSDIFLPALNRIIKNIPNTYFKFDVKHWVLFPGYYDRFLKSLDEFNKYSTKKIMETRKKSRSKRC